MGKRQKPKRQKYRRLVGPVELPMTDAELLRDAGAQYRSALRRGSTVTGRGSGGASEAARRAPADRRS